MSFVDYFGAQAPAYAAFRPTYPEAMIAWLATRAPGRQLAWDCGTGSGQVALALAPHFVEVVGTDASVAQLTQARAAPNLRYWAAAAEACGLPDGCVDLITVAQALHWFDIAAFHREVRRVARPGALLAEWCYALLEVDDVGLSRTLARFHDEIVGPYWPEERRAVMEGYAGLPFPFPRLPSPPFAMTARWTRGQLAGYLRTWSATQRYREAQGEDPVARWEEEAAPHWEQADQRREVRWPLALRVGRVE